MKKILVILLCLLALCACAKEEDSGTMEIEEGQEPDWLAGGWFYNPDLPVINDEIFAKAAVDTDLQPLNILATQVVAGTNYAYLACDFNNALGASTAYKIVIVYNDLDDNSEVTKIADFDVEAYLEGDGNTTQDNLAGGWTNNSELPNMLDEDMNAAFDQALAELTGVDYEPVCVLASQVVAGTNYAILAKGTTVTAEAPTHLYIVSIYVDLENVATLNNICAIDISSFNQ